MRDTKITFILPSFNTVDYTKLAYESIKAMPIQHDVVILDDGSTDGTIEWMKGLKDDNLKLWFNETGDVVGHTTTYNIGVRDFCKTHLFSIAHSDMVFDADYVPNLVKWWKPWTVVSATRIEPEGLYPASPEKILVDFAMYANEFDWRYFNEVCEAIKEQKEDETTRGIFAPWLMSRDEYLELGGMDQGFAPYPHEDHDFFTRLACEEVNLIQSWDSLCYHFCSRGHRGWSNEVKKDHGKYAFYSDRAHKHFMKKWGQWTPLDLFRHPIITPEIKARYEQFKLDEYRRLK
jgi:GT2 family glycosyltransferase